MDKSDKIESDSNKLAVFGPSSSGNESLNIFKLNVDCFEHLFEWISLKDLFALRRTCKRMKAVAEYYIRLNYPQVLRLNISNRQKFLDFFQTRLNYFEWIRHLSIWNVELTDTQIDGIKYVLNQLESLELREVEIAGDFYEVLLTHCPRLKYLGVRTETAPQTIIGTGNKWLLRCYPTLVHIAIESWSSLDEPLQCTTELLTFFQQNPSIRIFSTNSTFLAMCRPFMLGSNIKFDRLNIYMNKHLKFNCQLANDFHRYEFYQHLHLYCNQEEFFGDQLLSEFHDLEKLHVLTLCEGFSIPAVESIKDVSIGMFYLLPSEFPELMATKFSNLRRIDIQFAHLRDVQTFIRYSAKLEEIKLWRLTVDNPDEPKISDFIALNEERKKLPQARKVTIFINEPHFLKLKFMGNIDSSLIAVKRMESCAVDDLVNWLQDE